MNINQLWLTYHIVQTCIESQFIVKAWWSVKPKYQLEELEMKDPYMADLVTKCLNTGGTDKKLVYRLCDCVLKSLGVFLRQSWSL